MFDLGPWHPRFKFDNNLLNKHFLQLVFCFLNCKLFCRVKTVEVEVDCYFKLVGGGGGF